MAYCTEADVTAAGAPAGATSPQLVAAIAEATERIDRFTDERFEPTALTVVTEFGSNGVAPLSRRVISVSAVRFVGATTDLDAGSYRVRLGSTVGDIDAIEMIGTGTPYNDLVAGAESWNGGYANLARPGRRITVTGSFGRASVPLTIKRATAYLAAAILLEPAVGQDLSSGVRSISVEGYSVTFTDEVSDSSTGVREVDGLLSSFRRHPVMVSS